LAVKHLVGGDLLVWRVLIEVLWIVVIDAHAIELIIIKVVDVHIAKENALVLPSVLL
jgi:hypothetical protein